MLIYDNIADEIEEVESQGGKIDNELAQRLYNLYVVITDVLGKYEEEV